MLPKRHRYADWPAQPSACAPSVAPKFQVLFPGGRQPDRFSLFPLVAAVRQHYHIILQQHDRCSPYHCDGGATSRQANSASPATPFVQGPRSADQQHRKDERKRQDDKGMHGRSSVCVRSVTMHASLRMFRVAAANRECRQCLRGGSRRAPPLFYQYRSLASVQRTACHGGSA